MSKQTKELVQEITDYLNTFNSKEKEFCEAMSCEHRTLQQNFTRLCLQWIEHCASHEYRTDGRNQQSHEVSRRILELWGNKMKDMGYNGLSLDIVDRPSKWLSTI